MIEFKQLNKHDPENGVWGDCARTVFACLLDMDPDTIPHFRDKGQPGLDETKNWLKDQGLTLISIPMNPAPIEDILKYANVYIQNCHYMLLGESKNGVNHVVICFNDEIVHDTSQDNSGIIGPCDDGYYWVEFLAKTI